MKNRISILIILLVFILAIGAVSASDDIGSDDNLTLSNEEFEMDEDTLELSEDSQDVLEDYIIGKNYKTDIYVNSTSPVVSVYTDEVSGNVTVSINGNETPTYNQYLGDYASITLNDLGLNSIGTYYLDVKFIPYSGDPFSIVKYTLTVRNLSKEDFSINFKNSLWVKSESSVINIRNRENVKGNVTVCINGNETPAYNNELGYVADIKLSNLGINTTGTYDLLVRFIQKSGDTITLLNNSLTVRNISKEDFSLTTSKTVPISTTAEIIKCRAGNNIKGNLTVYVNGNETPAVKDVITGYEYYLVDYDGEYIYLSDLGISTTGEYDILINFTSDLGNTITLDKYKLTVRQLTANDFLIMGTATVVPITSEDSVIYYYGGEYYSLDFNGNLTIDVDGKIIQTTLNKELYLSDLGITNIGTYDIIIIFSPTLGDNVTVRNYTLNVTPEEVFTKDDFSVTFDEIISVNSKDNVLFIRNGRAGGNITVKIDGNVVANSRFGDKEWCAFNLNNLGINKTGSYGIIVSYVPPTGDSLILIEDTLNVTEAEGLSGVSVRISKHPDYGGGGYEFPDLIVTESSNVDGNILIYIDEELYYNETSHKDWMEGYYIFLNDLNRTPSFGKHVVQVKFEKDNNITLIKTRCVNILSTIYFKTYDIEVNSDKVIDIYLPRDADGDLYVIFEGDEQNITYSNGHATYNLSTKSLNLNKKYTIYVELRGDSFYPTERFEDSFTTIPHIIQPKGSMSDNETQAIVIDLPSNCGGTIYLYNAIDVFDGYCVKDGDAIASAKLVNGKASIPISGLSKGYHWFIVEYVDGDYVYYNSDVSVFSVNVKNNTETISADLGSDTVEVGDTAEINITGPNTLYEAFEIYLDGNLIDEVYMTPSGTVTCQVPISTSGRHVIKVLYEASGDFYSNTFYVNKDPEEAIAPTLSVKIDDFEVGSAGSIDVTVIPSYSGNVTVLINNTELTYTFIINDGHGNLPITPSLPTGTYTAIATFNGTVNTTTFKITAKKVTPSDPNLQIHTSGIRFGENAVIHVSVNKSANGNVTVNINSQDYPVSIKNGEGSISISNLGVGYYNIKATFNGDPAFYNVTVTSYIIVSEPLRDANVQIEEKSDDSILIIKFEPDATGYVTVFVNDVRYTVVQIVNGIARIDLSAFKNGNYIIRIEYSGDSKYAPFTKTDKVSINKKSSAPKISLVLKAVKVKRSAKKLILQATLKQGKTPLKAKKIVFRFNGKKYTAKTNKKGIAKVVIPKSVLKKLKVGKTVKYQASYDKKTVKKSVKVKK